LIVVVSYDVETKTKEGKARLRKVGRACLDYGQRVQFSVFECDITPESWIKLKSRLMGAYDPKRDSLRFYFLGERPGARIEHHGAKASVDFGGLLMA
jgi:CRISPR-associated protein Cas2